MSRPTITFLGKEHPLFFSLDASAKLEEHFGSIAAMGEVLDAGKPSVVAPAVDFVLGVLMEAGRIVYQAEGRELPDRLPCKPSDLIDVTDPAAFRAISQTLAADGKREVEAVPEGKNAETTPGL